MIHPAPRPAEPDGRILRHIRHGGFKITVLDDRATGELIEKCCPKQQKATPGFERLQGSDQCLVHRFHHENRALVRKVFFNRSPMEPVKDLFRGSRASRSARGDLLLLTNGFNAPECLLVGKGKGISFCISEFIPNAADLLSLARQAVCARKSWGSTPSERRLVEALGKEIGKLHAKNIIHGDLRLKNILVELSSPPREVTVWFLDNERTRKYKKLPPRLRIKNLVQINMIPPGAVNDRERMRFFRQYLKHNPGDGFKRRELIQAVAQITARRMEKYRT